MSIGDRAVSAFETWARVEPHRLWGLAAAHREPFALVARKKRVPVRERYMKSRFGRNRLKSGGES